MKSGESDSEYLGASAIARHSAIVEQASIALRSGEVVIIPTDTVYGLAAAIDREDALSRLYALKARPLEKAIPVLLSDTSQLHQVAASLTETAEFLASHFWPGALTLVLPALPHLPALVTSKSENGRRTVAARVPDDPLARSIIAAAGGALAVTSANRSGQKPALDAAEATLLTASPPLLVVDGGRALGGIPSTVILAVDADPVILRSGAISPAAVFEALNNRGDVEERVTSADFDQPSTDAIGDTRAANTSS